VSAATVVMNCDLVDLPRSAPRADYAKPRPRKRRSGRLTLSFEKNREIDTIKVARGYSVQIIHKCAFDSARRSDCLHAIPHTDFQAAATISRHVLIAAVRSVRCVWAELRWRWTLKVLKTAACVERNFWADPALLKRCILRSRRRVGGCEFSARLFFHRPR
jgi:hypothetical protein